MFKNRKTKKDEVEEINNEVMKLSSKEYSPTSLIYIKFFPYIVLFNVACALFIISSLLQLMPSDANSARYMISALIQSEAAILGIVITLSLIAVQQSASSLSPRVVEVFKSITKNPDFYILIVVYIVAIFYSSLVLKIIDDNLLVESNINYLLQNLIWSTFYLALFAFSSLVIYIRHTLDLLNPAQMIVALSEKITYENILAGTGLKFIYPSKSRILTFIKYDREHTISILRGNPRFDKDEDPLLPLVDIVRSSLMRYDYETAINGLKTIEFKVGKIIETEDFEQILHSESIPENLLNFADFGDVKNITELKYFLIKKMYTNVFKHFERLGQIAVTRTDYHSSNEIVQIIANLMKQILQKENINSQASAIIESAISSLEIIGITANIQKTDNITFYVFDVINEIKKLTIEKKLLSPSQKAGRALVRVRPDFAWAWIYKGESAQAFGQLSFALDDYDKSIQLEENSHAWTKIGEIKEKLGDHVASKKAYDRANLVAQEEADDFFRHEF